MTYKSYTNKMLLKENVLVCAYICFLMEVGYNGTLKPLLEKSSSLEKEIKIRKITDKQVLGYIDLEYWNHHEQIVIGTYLFPEIDFFNFKIGHA